MAARRPITEPEPVPSTPILDSRAPVIVTGMHRSGTSLVASWLRAMGVLMGEDVLPADANNPHGYFEDTSFLELDRRLLRRATPTDDGGHPDWGWTESEQLDVAGLDEDLEAASELITARAAGGGYWGWKDPRTTLLLDFWDRAAGGEARYVLLYRYPWDVADSMQRLGASVFLDHPEYAYRIWPFYNRFLLDFYRRHEDRAILASSNALVHDPGAFSDLLRDKLGLELESAVLSDVFDGGEMFATLEGEDPLIGLVSATSPQCVELLAELDRRADLSSAGRGRDPGSRAGESDDGPAVSVIIACLDHGQFLLEAVASVERCAPGCETIIIDDGSRQPRTLEILEILRNAQYRVVSQENQGLSAARNAGIELARAAYVLPLDADNRLRPGYVSASVEILDSRPEVGVVYSDRREFGIRSGLVELGEFDLDRLLMMNYIDACAVFRKELWSAAGGYDPGMMPWDDWGLWVAACEQGWQFHHLTEAGFDYRVRPGSLVALADERENRRRLVERVVERHPEIYERRRTALAVRSGQLVQQLLDTERELGAEIMARDVEIARRSQQIRELDAKYVQQCERTRELDAKYVQQCERTRELDAEFIRRCEQIRERDAEIEQLRHTVAEQQLGLERIHASRSWRWASSLGRLTDRLLPRGSARRRFFGRVLGPPQGGR